MKEIPFLDTGSKIRVVEYYGLATIYGTLNPHWVVNGKRFNYKPTDEEIEEAYKE